MVILAGFYVDWASYRSGPGKYSYENLGPCSVAIYSFAVMHRDTFEIAPADEDAAKNQYSGFVSYCNSSGKKPVLALGGWVDSAGDKYSKMLNQPQNRKAFIVNTVKFLKKFGFKGLNIDIEYPTCPQHDMKNGNPKDKDEFTNMIQEMRKEFNKNQFELSVSIPGNTDVIDRAYDIEALSEYLDWIGVMTYDYHVSSGNKTGPISSLADTKITIDHIIDKGVSREKIVLGIPFYGHRYTLSAGQEPGYGVTSEGTGPPGLWTATPGYLAHYEIINLINRNDYVCVNDVNGSYVYKANDFISFNSERDIIQKMELVKTYNLGGVMVWETSMDDFTGEFCNKGTNPLLHLINSIIADINKIN